MKSIFSFFNRHTSTVPMTDLNKKAEKEQVINNSYDWTALTKTSGVFNFLKKLNSHQIEAVMDNSRACLVNANVGSGKTTVLISKILFLHAVKGVSYKDMVVLTFTNKAANEIRERLISAEPDVSEIEMRYFGTFHSVAVTLLRTVLDVESIGFSKDFAVIDSDEENDLALSLIERNALNIKYKSNLTKRIERAAQGKDMYGNMKITDDIQQLLEILQEEKRTQNKMDFNDLIVFTAGLLSNIEFNPAWIIIDEFQDTNPMQMRFIDTMVGVDTKLFAVGDPNQIIYTWRGSSKTIISDFKAKYRARELSLPENYRSSSTILDVARCFLEEGSDLSGVREPGNKIVIKNHYNPFNEAQYLADKIARHIKNGMKYSDIAIFYRTQKQSKTLEDVFSRVGIPYEVSVRKTLKDIPVLNWIMKILTVSINPYDEDNMVSVLSDSRYGEKLSLKAARKLVRNIINADTMPKERTLPELFYKIKGFKDWSERIFDFCNIYSYFDFDSYINPTSVSFSEDKQYVIKLLKKIEEYSKIKGLSVFYGVQSFVNSAALYGVNILSEDVHLENNTVKLMTLHSAKGLEFCFVYIIGVNYGLIPLRTSTEDEEAEERRLFFVGITRAKDSLEMSYYTNPDNQRVAPGPSRYLNIIPKSLIIWDDLSSDGADLQSYRKDIRIAQADNNCVNEIRTQNKNNKEKNVRHAKYGIGTVIFETDDTVTVLFDGYGEKEFMKIFEELEYF